MEQNQSKRVSNQNFKEIQVLSGRYWRLSQNPDLKNAMDCKDRCYRLSGQILTIPVNEEEEKLLDKTGWNYMMKLKTCSGTVSYHVGFASLGGSQDT